MAAIYSQRLYSRSGQVAGDGAVQVDVPAGKVMIVREVDGYSGDVGGPVVFFEDHATGGTWLVHQGPGLSTTSFQWTGRLVFESDGFNVRVDSGTWDVYVSGYLLDAP